MPCSGECIHLNTVAGACATCGIARARAGEGARAAVRPSRARKLALALALALAPELLASPAAAQSPADVAAARELFMEGARLAQEGKWEEARARYERSLALKRAAATLYSLGVAQRRTGKLVEALESFRAFLLEPSSLKNKRYQKPAQEAVAELEKQVARIEIQLAPKDAPGLAVEVDGAPVPTAALEHPRLVNPGPHEIVARAEGYKEARGRVTSKEGGRDKVVLELKRAPVIAEKKPSPAPAPAPAPSRAEAPPPSPSRALPIALLIGGGTVLAAGAAVGIVAVVQADKAPSSDGEDAEAVRTQALVGDIAAGVGAAAASVGLLMLLLEPSPPPAAQQGAVRVWIGAGSAGLTGRF